MSGPRHFFLEKPTPGKFRVQIGRHGGRYFFEFDTLEESVAWVLRNEDSDEHYIAAIEDPEGQTVHDHFSPFTGWAPPLTSHTLRGKSNQGAA